MIDLHVHSTASDGTLAPEALASRLARDGVTTFSLCDHDTTAGLAAAADGARAAGLGFLAGIEITAIEDGKDVHVLGYGIDPASAPLAAFLAEQRAHRRARIAAIEERLAALGVPVTLVADGRASGDDAGRAIGRPVVARALVAAGHVASISEAFDRYLTPGQPAFVPRTGAPVPEVVAMIARAGGIASLAHPGQTKRDDAIERWVACRPAGHRGVAQPPRRGGGRALHRHRGALRAADDGRLRLPRRRHGPHLPGRRGRGAAGGVRPADRPPGRARRRAPLMPALELTGVVKDYRGLRPLRIADLVVEEGDRVAIAGLDRAAAEVFVDVVNGALLPDAGVVRVLGRSTADITEGDDWLSWLDAFGILTQRAVLLESSTLAQNLALPLSLEIDPMPAELRAKVDALAAEVDLPAERLDRPIGDAPPIVRLRAHLGKALALGPRVVLLEHPTITLDPADVRPFADTVKRVADARRLTVVAVTEDAVFADVVATRAYKLNGGTGALTSTRGWRRFLP